MEEKSLKELKKNYDKLKQKYNLPDFTELNELFDIEEVESETEFLLRKIRRAIAEKISAYIRFIDLILNPGNAPILFFRLVKKLSREDMDSLSRVYGALGKFEIMAIILDIDYSEKKEAEFIKNIFKSFNEIKKDLLMVIEKLNVVEEKNRRTNGSYFG